MTELVLSAALKGTVVVAAAWIATAAARRAPADLRHRIWLAALVGWSLLLIPAPLPDAVRISVAAGLDGTAAATAAARSVPWVTWIWLFGAAGVLLRFSLGMLHLFRLTRRATPTGTHSVRVTGAIASPLTWGARDPVILLPAYAMNWPEEKRAVVLAHERAHIARRDWLWQSYAALVTAVFWFHPLVWFAASKLRQEAEQAADDAVLAGGAAGAGYAAQLLEVARQVRGRAPHAAMAVTMVRHGSLSARIAAILDGSRARARAGVRSRAAVVLVCACLVPLLSAFQNRPADGQATTDPIVISKTEAQYSERALEIKFQGAVLLDLVVDTDGLPQDVRVVRRLGLGLDEEAVEAVRQWRFLPATKGGEPVAANVRVEVIFRLDPDGKGGRR